METQKRLMPTLEVYKAKTLIGSFFLTEDIITVGRAGDNDIVLPDNKLKVSRYHAVLLRNSNNPEGYIIRDLSSLQGTKFGGSHIIQKALEEGDVIHIVDFRLKYIAHTDNSRFPFRITDETPGISFSSFPSDIGEQSTRLGRIKEFMSSLSPALSKETNMLFEELLYQVNSSFTTEVVLNSAIDLFFHALNMTKDCFGCFALFEGKDNLRCLAVRGTRRASIPLPYHVIEKVKAGQSFIMGNQLWIPFSTKEKASRGFLYLYRGTYAPPFHEDEVKLVSLISDITADVIDKVEIAVYEEEFIKWPRDMIGSDKIFMEIKRVAPLDVNVLLLGETGVGKEVAAEEIHRHSHRKDKILRKVNCAAIPKDLIESELFGHKKGAFTGATEDKKGEFELADGGTIFLDEIGDLPWESQKRLLRVIQEKKIKRLGEEKERKIDVRIIAATNRDIQKDMEDGKFGSDLYYRFGERIFIPPLRERKKDIPLLAHYYLDKFAEAQNLRTRGITPHAMKCLLAYSWPGNTRELRDCISKALSISKGIIFLQHLPDEVRKYKKPDSEKKFEKSKPKSSDEVEKEHIMETLRYTRGNKEKAIEILKIAKQTLYNKMEKYKIPEDFGKI